MMTKNLALGNGAADLRRQSSDAVARSPTKTTALLAFLFLGVIWGSNFIFMKWAAQEISPAQIVLLRAVFGFLPVFLYALSQRALHWEHVRYAHHFVVMSLLATAIYYFAFAKGAALLPSSIAGLLIPSPCEFDSCSGFTARGKS
jgi:drug/metabolite transporter (DMT)-like permease